MKLTRSRALVWLTLVWIILRIYPAVMGWSSTGTEVWQAHKLLDYGVEKLKGGALSMQVWTGTVAHPENYLYTHHPYPIFWFCTVVYCFFGVAGVATVMFILKYAGLILCFLILERQYSINSAFWATLLYAVAPCNVLLEGNANSVVVASTIWPLAVALIVLRLNKKDELSRGDLILAAATTFIGGQISWFSLSIVPALGLIAGRATSFRPGAVFDALIKPVSLAFVGGGVLSLLVFCCQVAFYEPDFLQLKDHLVLKLGASSDALPRIHLVSLIPFRVLGFAGITAVLVSLAGLVYVLKSCEIRTPLLIGVSFYFLTFVLMVLVLPHFFYTENHIYTFLIFPSAVMAAMLFENVSVRIKRLIIFSSLIGIAVSQLYASFPTISPMARFMGGLFAAHSKKTDFIFTNIKPPSAPYKASDVTAPGATKLMADRFIVFGVHSTNDWIVAPDLVNESTGMQFWYFRSQRLSDEINNELRVGWTMTKTVTVVFPERRESFADRLRSFYWYELMKKGRRNENQPVSSDVIDIFERSEAIVPRFGFHEPP